LFSAKKSNDEIFVENVIPHIKKKLAEYESNPKDSYDLWFDFPIKFLQKSKDELIAIHGRLVKFEEKHAVVGRLISYQRGN
jgi:hypothetical protein